MCQARDTTINASSLGSVARGQIERFEKELIKKISRQNLY